VWTSSKSFLEKKKKESDFKMISLDSASGMISAPTSGWNN
jgi:hypothetical protein